MIRGFFFDLDGTLVDTHNSNFEAYRRALLDFGVELTFDQFRKSIGHQAKVFLPWFAPGLESDDYERIAQKKKEYYKEAARLSIVNEQLVRFIASVKPDHAIALVTTAKRDNAQTILEHHKLGRLFDVVVTAEDVLASKPSPEAYLIALRKTGLGPKEVVAFEDSQPGLEAATAAGIAVIQVKDFQV